MRIIPTRKYSSVTPFRKQSFLCRIARLLPRDERGQGILEYVLVLIVVLGSIFVMARPVIAKMQKSFEKSLKGGIFKEDASGSNFYYFPVGK